LEKNVGGIDLEELKRAREELMQERGLTEEAPASSFEPADDVVDSYQDTSYQDDGNIESSPLDNPNVSRVFERQEPKPVEKPQEEDDDIDIDALVNEVFDDAYESQFGESFEKAMAEADDFDSNDAETESSFDAEVSSIQEPEPVVESKPEPVEEVSESRDFSVYDSFAAFEVNHGAAAAAPVEPIKEPEPVEPATSSSLSDVETKLESVNEQLRETWLDNSYADMALDSFETVEENKTEPANDFAETEAVESHEAEENSALDNFAEFEINDGAAAEAPVESTEEPETEELTDADVNDMAFASLAGLGAFDFGAEQKPEDPAVKPVEEVEETAEEKEEPVVVEIDNLTHTASSSSVIL
jgi:hypothetical protein